MATLNAPCPNCGSTDSVAIPFTWWGGPIGPKLLSHVKCQKCGQTFNVRTGKTNTVAITIVLTIAFVLCVAAILAIIHWKLHGI